jgi:hypothetical protein
MPRQCAWWQRQAHFPEDVEEDKHMEDDVEEAHHRHCQKARHRSQKHPSCPNDVSMQRK